MSDKNLSSSNEGSRSKKSSLWMEDGKTLSKSLMYAPLVAYQKAAVGSSSSSSKATHPSQYMSAKKNVSASLRESSLASTLHFVSCDYHRNRATVNDAKNNGSRPIGLSDVDERIRQRAVTLLGGGINASIPVGKKVVRSKKRRRRSWETAKPFLSKSFTDEAVLRSDSGDILSFLRKLNSTWNDYVWKLLSNDKDNGGKRQLSDDELNEIEVRLGSLVSRKDLGRDGGGNKNDGGFHQMEETQGDKIDLIGAHLKIIGSNSRRSWVGRFGVLVGETTNTYRIATYAPHRKMRKNASKEANGMNIEVLVLPKQGSVVQLILPLLPYESKDVDCNNEPVVESEGVALETTSIIALQDEAIGISITN